MEKDLFINEASPDFYWKHRIDKLEAQKGHLIPFNAARYAGVESTNYERLYNIYYVELYRNGHMEDFDIVAESEYQPEDFQAMWDYGSDWMQSVKDKSKPVTKADLPEDPFDLIKLFIPEYDLTEVQQPFSVEDVGTDFPYQNWQEMSLDAQRGQLKWPQGVQLLDPMDDLDPMDLFNENFTSYRVFSQITENYRAKLAASKERALAELDEAYEKAVALAKDPLNDEEGRAHYRWVKEKLKEYPDTPEGWQLRRENMLAKAEEMAEVASKRPSVFDKFDAQFDADHHFDPEKDAIIQANQIFQTKYGRNLEEIQESYRRYEEDPVNYLDKLIAERFGAEGTAVWKQAQVFNRTVSVEEQKKADVEFRDFLKTVPEE